MSAIEALISFLGVPEYFEGGIGSSRQCGNVEMPHVFPVRSVVELVLADDHPGDDAAGPRAMLNFCGQVFDARKFLRLLQAGGGRIELTKKIARQCVKAYDDDLSSWACWVASADEENGGPGLMLNADQAAVVVCIVAVLRLLSPEGRTSKIGAALARLTEGSPDGAR